MKATTLTLGQHFTPLKSQKTCATYIERQNHDPFHLLYGISGLGFKLDFCISEQGHDSKRSMVSDKGGVVEAVDFYVHSPLSDRGLITKWICLVFMVASFLAVSLTPSCLFELSLTTPPPPFPISYKL